MILSPYSHHSFLFCLTTLEWRRPLCKKKIHILTTQALYPLTLIILIIKTKMWSVLRGMRPPKKNPLIHQTLLASLCAVQPSLVGSNGRILVNHACASLHYMCWIWVKVIACPWGSISYMDLECGWGLRPQAAVWVALCNELQLLPTDLMSLWKCITWIPLPMPHSHPFSFVHLWTGH